jgi:hypothetical protein
MRAIDAYAFSDIHLIHGPCGLLAQYFLRADALARDRGVFLRVRSDFDRLLKLNEQHAASWAPLAPMFNPNHCDLSRDNAFWIEGVDEAGDTAVIHASRLYDHGARSVADDLRSLRMFYDDPSPHHAAGAHVEVSAPSAYHLCGRVAFAGALWVRPDCRRLGFSKFVPRLTRGFALTQWNAPAYWGAVEPALNEIGITRAYGSWHVEDGFTVHIPGWRGELKSLFLSMGQVTLLRDLADALAQPGAERLRRSERPITKESPARRHGMSMRS